MLDLAMPFVVRGEGERNGVSRVVVVDATRGENPSPSLGGDGLTVAARRLRPGEPSGSPSIRDEGPRLTGELLERAQREGAKGLVIEKPFAPNDINRHPAVEMVYHFFDQERDEKVTRDVWILINGDYVLTVTIAGDDEFWRRDGDKLRRVLDHMIIFEPLTPTPSPAS